ncbi:MAG TPA: hypothetical protein VGC24_07220, partial [Burkholderiaceae bacterium]
MSDMATAAAPGWGDGADSVRTGAAARMRRTVRPTGAGAVYFLLALGLVLAAINDNNNLMYLLAFLMIGAGLASLPMVWLALRGVAAQCESEPWFA